MPKKQSESDFDVLDQLESNVTVRKLSIAEFATSPAYCGKHLYPRQRVFLKLLFLEDLDDNEQRILEGMLNDKEITLSPALLDRVEWLKNNGFEHFREVVIVGGRRSSKGFLTGIIMAYKLYNALSIPDPNKHYGIDPNKEIYFSCVAASEKQAKETQYADFATTVGTCAAMQPYLHKMQELEFSLHTEADRRLLSQLRRGGKRVQRDIAKLRGRALPANSRTVRGYTSMCICLDEFAHFQEGESHQSDDEIYEAALPSLAQFPTAGMLLANSSPYSKVGKFYERYVEGMEMDNGKPASPSMLTIQLPSWSFYEGWWDDPDYKGPKHCQIASPDWDPERKKKDGSHYYSKQDRQAILVERENLRSNPEKFKVERRAIFSETIDAYLMPEMVDRMFAGRPTITGRGFEPIETNWDQPSYQFRYKAHLDPSSTTAGFGFALAHIEEMEVGSRVEPHVVFDIVHRWQASDFPGGVIDWESILPWVLNLADLFRPYEITFDQFSSGFPIQWLRRELRMKNIFETRVYERTATASSNWDTFEIFKTALYRGLVHAPSDTEDAEHAALELKYLQEIRMGLTPRVDKQDHGPVTTKDMADCMVSCVESLIGNRMASEEREYMSTETPRFGAAGGYPLGGPDRGGRGNARPSPFGELYGARRGEQRIPLGSSSRGRGGSPRRWGRG